MKSHARVYRGAVAIDDVADDPIGRYVLVRRLGQGGMGEVWLARDPALGRDVAIKLQHEQGDDDHRRALREARALAAVAHPNVLPVFEVGVAGERTYLVMEHVGGDNLRVHLARRQHTVAEIVALFVGAARGLAALHAAGLVHCDFKPDNVLVDTTATSTRVLICDLGLVSSSAELHPTGGDDAAEIETTPGFGTPRYMAPEQHQGEVPTARADQYAWCVALFEAIYGRPPFRGDVRTLYAAKRGGLSAPVSTTTERRIYEVIRRGLAPDPAARFGDMRALLAALGGDARTRSPWPYAVPIVGLAALGYVLEAALLAAATWAARVGDGERALAYVDEAREIYARLMPPDHVRRINFYRVEAAAWDTVFQYAAAFASVAHAREQQVRWVPNARALAAQLDGQMGVYARLQGDIDLARRLQYSALVETEAEVGPEAPRTALRLHNLAVLEQEAGECARAHGYAARADAIYAVAYAADHPHRIMLAQAMADPCVAP